MKNIPEWVAEEIVKLRDSGHSFADIEAKLRRKDFSLERHTISKVYREAKPSGGVTSSGKSPEKEENPFKLRETYENKIVEMVCDIIEMLKDPVLKGMIIDIFDCEDCPICLREEMEKWKGSAHQEHRKLEDAAEKIKELQGKLEELELRHQIRKGIPVKIEWAT